MRILKMVYSGDLHGHCSAQCEHVCPSAADCEAAAAGCDDANVHDYVYAASIPTYGGPGPVGHQRLRYDRPPYWDDIRLLMAAGY